MIQTETNTANDCVPFCNDFHVKNLLKVGLDSEAERRTDSQAYELGDDAFTRVTDRATTERKGCNAAFGSGFNPQSPFQQRPLFQSRASIPSTENKHHEAA